MKTSSSPWGRCRPIAELLSLGGKYFQMCGEALVKHGRSRQLLSRSSPSSGLNTTDFTALLTFIVPEQIVYTIFLPNRRSNYPSTRYYSMEGFETWKFAWVQYLAILFPSYLIATCVLSFCYRNSLVGVSIYKRRKIPSPRFEPSSWILWHRGGWWSGSASRQPSGHDSDCGRLKSRSVLTFGNRVLP